jgi:hypothetical protein
VFNLTQQNASKPETILRILRSFRIKILHLFCNTVQRDVYFDSLKIQSLHKCNELRRHALLFPQNDNKLFTIKLSPDNVENLSFKEKLQVLRSNAV